MTEPTPDPTPKPTFEARMEGLGHEAEAAGKRLASDPVVAGVALTLARTWGLIVLAVGLWFFADVTLALDMPAVPWGDLWPLAIILVGLFIVVRGMTRRRA